MLSLLQVTQRGEHWGLMYRPETPVASLLNGRAQFIHEKYVEPDSSMPLYWALLEMTLSYAVT